MSGRDHRRAAAVPTERFAEWNMEIQREIAVGLVIFENFVGQLGPPELIAEPRRRWIRSVTRARDVVFADQIHIDVQGFHSSPRTVATKASMFSSFAFGGTPWPRLK